MGNLDRNYAVEITLKDSKVKAPTMEVFTTDTAVFNMLVQLKSVTNTIISNADLGGYTVKLFAIKPDNTYVTHDGVVVEGQDKLLFDLDSKFNNKIGTYKCEFTVTKDTETICTNSFSYTVKAPVHDGLSQEVSEMKARSIQQSPYDECIEKLNSKCDDFRFDGEVLTMLSNGKEIRKIYLNKMLTPIATNKEVGAVKPSKGLKLTKAGTLSVDENFIKKIAEEVAKELINDMKINNME